MSYNRRQYSKPDYATMAGRKSKGKAVNRLYKKIEAEIRRELEAERITE